MLGWRCWDVNSDGTLWSPLNYGDDVEWPTHLAARCDFDEDHEPPVADCSCGLRAMPRLKDFVSGIMKTPDLFLPKVVGRVRLTGRRAGRDEQGDPLGAIRAAGAEIVGPLLIGEPFRCVAQLLANRYGCRVVVADVDQREWIASGALQRDATAVARDDLDVLGARYFDPAPPRQGTVLAWRCWGLLNPAETGYGRLASMLDPNDGIIGWRKAPQRARCAFHDHDAPDVGCRCGWRGQRRLQDLTSWLRYEKNVLPHVVGLVELSGRIVAGDPAHPEQLDVVRAATARVTGPLWIAPGMNYAGEHADALLDRYDVEVFYDASESIPPHEWLTDTLHEWVEPYAAAARLSW